MRYNERVQEYNTATRQFPANLTAKTVQLQGVPVLRSAARSEAGAEGQLLEAVITARNVTVPLPWERLLWSGRPRCSSRACTPAVSATSSPTCAWCASPAAAPASSDLGHRRGPSTRPARAHPRRLDHSTSATRDHSPASVRALAASGAAPQLAALLELLAADPRARANPRAAGAALAVMAWEPRETTPGARECARRHRRRRRPAVIASARHRPARHRRLASATPRRCDLSERA